MPQVQTKNQYTYGLCYSFILNISLKSLYSFVLFFNVLSTMQKLLKLDY